MTPSVLPSASTSCRMRSTRQPSKSGAPAHLPDAAVILSRADNIRPRADDPFGGLGGVTPPIIAPLAPTGNNTCLPLVAPFQGAWWATPLVVAQSQIPENTKWVSTTATNA